MNKTMMISAALLSALAGLTATAQNPGVAAFKPFSAQVKMTSYDDQGVLSPLSISWFEGGWKDGSRVETRTSSKGYTSRSLDLYDPKQGVFIHVLANDKNNLISTYGSGRAGVPRHRDRCAEFIPDDVISYTDSLLGFTAIHTVQEEEDGTQEMWYLPDLSCYRARESTRYKDSATGKYTGAIFVREAVSVSATEPDEALRKLPDNAQDVPPSQYHLAVTPEGNCCGPVLRDSRLDAAWHKLHDK